MRCTQSRASGGFFEVTGRVRTPQLADCVQHCLEIDAPVGVGQSSKLSVAQRDAHQVVFNREANPTWRYLCETGDLIDSGCWWYGVPSATAVWAPEHWMSRTDRNEYDQDFGTRSDRAVTNCQYVLGRVRHIGLEGFRLAFPRDLLASAVLHTSILTYSGLVVTRASDSQRQGETGVGDQFLSRRASTRLTR